MLPMHIAESNRGSSRQFDAIIVGSGATGGCAAKVLCEGGLNVLLIEAGGDPAPAGDQPNKHVKLSRDCKHEVQSRCVAYNRHTREYFIDDEMNPYGTPADKPFLWIRSQVVGGRTMLWAGQSYRMSDFDFKAARSDGFDQEWPISYEELAPYYARAERILAVRGTREKLPQLPDGDLLPSGVPDANASYLRSAFAKCGQALIPARISAQSSGAAASFCVHCNRKDAGCSIPVSSVSSTLMDALKTGRLTLLSNTLVRYLVTDNAGKAIGVYAINKQTRQESEFYGRLFFLCASTLESTRIMLNSVSRLHPAGFGNSSGTLGRYLMDHISGIAVTAVLEDQDQSGGEQAGPPVQSLYVPRSQNLTENRTDVFLRGYGHQLTLLKANRFASSAGPSCGDALPSEGNAVQRPTFLEGKVIFRIQAFGEMLPRPENYIEIDTSGKVDAWGIPVLKIHCAHGENERRMAADMISNSLKLAEAASAKVVSVQKTLQEPGLCIHETGTCRMGADPKRAMLNRYNQCHDALNVFVTDGSCFTSQGTQNPTLTMMALTIRAAEYALVQSRRNELR